VTIRVEVCLVNLLYVNYLADRGTGTGWWNCEIRHYEFSTNSKENDAHLVETAESRNARGAGHIEDDPHVLEELERVSSKGSDVIR
jgi:hypothetical protein